MAIKGIMFDLDGTLLDSNYFWKNLGSEYLKSKNIKMCIVTLTELDFVTAVFKRLKISKYFCDIITTGESGLTKINYEIFDYAVNKMGIGKKEKMFYYLKIPCIL